MTSFYINIFVFKQPFGKGPHPQSAVPPARHGLKQHTYNLKLYVKYLRTIIVPFFRKKRCIICGRRDGLLRRDVLFYLFYDHNRDGNRDGIFRLCDTQLNYNREGVAIHCKYSVDINNHCTGMYKAL